MNKNKDIKQWLAIAEKYFDATATAEEEKALAAFLATEESDIPEFNEIKAVMGYLATARAIEKEHARKEVSDSRRFAVRWTAAAAAIAPPILFTSFIPISIIFPVVTALMYGPSPSFFKTAAPEPVTVHWADGAL